MKSETRIQEITDTNPTSPAAGLSPSNTEVESSFPRRRLSASYKLKIVNRIDQAQGRGEIGQILRKVLQLLKEMEQQNENGDT